jgi:hypothetical protein
MAKEARELKPRGRLYFTYLRLTGQAKASVSEDVRARAPRAPSGKEEVSQSARRDKPPFVRKEGRKE